MGVLVCWRNSLCVRFELTGGLGGDFVRDVPYLRVLAAFCDREVDGDDAEFLLDEEELRFDEEEFDLDCCLS